MSTSTVSNIDEGIVQGQQTGLPRHDWIILPLLSLLTIAFCLGVAEVATQHVFKLQDRDYCKVGDDEIGFRYRPYCTVRLKAAEGPWVTNVCNACGYRTMEACGPKPAGTTRIALLGASVSEGLYIPYDQTFATRMAKALTQDLGRPVEVQNMGRVGVSLINSLHQVNEALALKPEVLMLVVDPYDIEHLDPAKIPDRFKPIPSMVFAVNVRDVAHKSLLQKVDDLAKASSLATAAGHLFFQDGSTYLRVYLQYRDHADYLREPLSPAWQKRLAAVDVLIGDTARAAQAQHVPFVLVEVPSLAQADLLKMAKPPKGLDAYLLSGPLQQICSRYGVQFINTLDAFQKGPPPNQLYYVVDTHLNGKGQELVSQVLTAALLKQQRSALLGENGATPASTRQSRTIVAPIERASAAESAKGQ